MTNSRTVSFVTHSRKHFETRKRAKHCCVLVSQNNSSSGDAPEGSKLSDVVRGNTRPNSVRATAASSGSTSTPQVVATAAAPACVADPSSVPQTPSSSAVTQLTAVSAVVSPVAKETEVSANGNLPSHPVNSASASATAVDSSVNTSRSVWWLGVGNIWPAWFDYLFRPCFSFFSMGRAYGFMIFVVIMILMAWWG